MTKFFLWLVLILTAATLAGQTQQKQANPKPNVIVILSDDQGTLDLKSYGAKDLETPNLDALARQGVRFTQFYAAAPICSPSRAALLTGKVPQRAGLASNAAPGKTPEGMPTEQFTMAEMMKKAGMLLGTSANGIWVICQVLCLMGKVLIIPLGTWWAV